MTEAPNVFSTLDKGVTEDTQDVKPVANEGDATRVSGELESLVGEGRKFKTVEELARGKKEADAFIQRLQGELEGLRAELKEREDSKRMVEDLRKELLEKKEPAPIKDMSNTDIKSVVTEQLKELEAQKNAEQNLKIINEKMFGKYGKDAADVVAKKAIALGVNKGFLESVALRSPQAFLTMMGVEEIQEASKPASGATKQGISSSVNVEAAITNVPQQAQKNYYDTMRKENPTLYWSAKVQNQLAKAIAEGKYF